MRYPLGPEWERRLFRLRQDMSVMRRLFPWRTTGVLVLAIATMAWLFQVIYARDLDEPLTYVQAVYAVLNMMFFQLAYTDVPADLNLAPFFVLVPVVGLGLFSLVGLNLLHVLHVFFVRRERGQRWQEALAATHREHIVVCGLGSIGYRVALQLAKLGQPVVGVELAPTELVDELMDADLPVILGDSRSRDVLEKAGVAQAETAVVCTNRDLANIEAALHIRELNPRARLILRIFEEQTAQSVRVGMDIDAVLSRSAIAAVAFAHAALGIEVLESFQLDGRNYVLARVPLHTGSQLIGSTVGEVATDRDATIIFLCRDTQMVNEPVPETRLMSGDDLFVFIASDRLGALTQRGFRDMVRDSGGFLQGQPERGNERAAGTAVEEGQIIVCGLGHLGFRVVNTLRGLGYRVTALERESGRLGQRLAQQGVSVRIADFRRRIALTEAGIERAQAIVVCAADDMLNLETGLRARELNPDIRIIIRVFEEELGRRLSRVFGIDAVYSTSALAAPAFADAALRLHLAQSVTIGEETLALVRLAIEPDSALIGQTVHELNAEEEVTVLLHVRGGRLDIPPQPGAAFHAEDEIVVLISPDRLRQLARLNRSVAPVQGV